MPRRPRIDLPGFAQHIVQRGNDRQPCFRGDIDRVRYLDELHEVCEDEDIAIHAYVLMTNHVHLLATPSCRGQVARVMQSLGRRYVRYFNDRHQRTGTLWEGRYHACLIDSDTYLLQCGRYIELNPVRANLVAAPEHYRWSSFAANALGAEDRLVRPHPTYLALGSTLETRMQNYRALFGSSPGAAELQTIRSNLQKQQPLGSLRFQSLVEAQLGRRVGSGKPGRPRKVDLRGKPHSDPGFADPGVAGEIAL